MGAMKAADLKHLFGDDLYAILEDFDGIQRDKTDVFRDRVQIPTGIKTRLDKARSTGLDAVREIEGEMGDIAEAAPAAVVDLYLSYRAVKGWKELIALAGKMPGPLASTLMVREQLALALNRDGQSDAAEEVLLDLIGTYGPNSETSSLLGRVYKDRWHAAAQNDDPAAPALLEKAIDTYLEGFESDTRDAFPGINALNLMEFREPPDARRKTIFPAVQAAVKQHISAGTPDYWDYATMMELAILGSSEADAGTYAAKAKAVAREVWELESTVRTLRLIREARDKHGEETGWIREIEDALLVGD